MFETLTTLYISSVTFKSDVYKVLVFVDNVSLFTKLCVDLAVAILKRRLLACDSLTKYTKWSVDNEGLRLDLESTHLTFRESL